LLLIAGAGSSDRHCKKPVEGGEVRVQQKSDGITEGRAGPPDIVQGTPLHLILEVSGVWLGIIFPL
jgi:hypothetical protein